MPNKNRLTNNADETDISNLLSGDTIYSVPYFQRAYKWKVGRLKQLHEDVLKVVDENDLHFLGALILHGRRTNPSDPDIYEIIDGHQRITTIYLYLIAIIHTLCDIKQIEEARNLFLKYIVINRDTGKTSNMKLHSCKEDRNQINNVLKDLLSDKDLLKSLGEYKLKYLPASGPQGGILQNNYREAVRLLKDQVDQAGLSRIKDIYTALLSSMSVVQIDVADPTNGPKIFDSLNSRQEPMTIGDLVRNEIFSRVADEDPGMIETTDENYWQPFYSHFKQNDQNLFDQYFFPYGLIKNPNLKKPEVYAALREEWKDIDSPEGIIHSLEQYQNAFIDIVSGKNYQKLNDAVYSHFRNLSILGAPSSVYPFMMNLSNSIRDNILSEFDGIEVLKVVESFLVRRAVCGHEPTGLHAVFKRLWLDCNGKPTRESVIKHIKKHRTVAWPTSAEFGKAIEQRPLYGTSIIKYLILQYDLSLGGDQPNDLMWIEHVLPEAPSAEWFKIFSKKQHLDMKDRLANLVPLSVIMNKKLSNQSYARKRGRYETDSMFKSAREFALQFEKWTPDALGSRAKMLSRWAITRWEY